MYNLDIFKDFGSRIESILIYKPLLDLDRKEKVANIPLSSIALSVLLFMIDNMLLYKKNNTYKDIAHFIQKVLKDEVDYDMSYTEAYDQTIILVRNYLRNSGQPFVIEYYDFEKHRVREKVFHLIDFDEDYDIGEAAKQSESFILTPDAIEGLFKTKEMFQEMQITIMQLYFRQQIDRGVFDGAISTVNEIIFVLRNRQNEMKLLLKSIAKDVLQVARENEFEMTIQRYDETLTNEKKSFIKLKGLIEYTLNGYYKGDGKWTEKEAKAIRSIRKVQRSWNEAIQVHEILFSLKQDIQKSFTENVEELMFHSFHTNINFEREILPLVIDNQLNLEGLVQIMKPVNPMKPKRLFHPSIFFQPQRRKKEYEKTNEEVTEISKEQKMKKEAADRRVRNETIKEIKSIFKWLFKPLLIQSSYEMKEYIKTIPEEIKSLESFYVVIIQIHQRRFISFEPIDPNLYPHLDEFALALSEFIDENEMNKVCKSASIKLIPDEFITLKGLGKELSNFRVRRNDDDK